jgi:hypothetical protein
MDDSTSAQPVLAGRPTEQELVDPEFVRGLLDVVKTILTHLVGHRDLRAANLERALRGDALSARTLGNPVRGPPGRTPGRARRYADRGGRGIAGGH